MIILTSVTTKLTAPPAITENIVEEAPKFYVLGEKAGKYSKLYLKEAIVNDAGYQFRLNVDSVELSVGDVHNINVLESDETSQLIEFNYINTYSSTSTYKVINNKIEPVSYQVNGNMGSAFLLMFLIIPAYVIAGSIVRYIRRKFWYA